MPKYRITLELPESDGEIFQEEVFLSNQEFVKRVMPVFHKMDALVHQVEQVPTVYEKQVIQAILDTGEPVDLLNFSFQLTYGDMIEGEPDAHYNEEILERLKRKYRESDIPTHIQKPSEEQQQRELPVFYGVAEWVKYSINTKAENCSFLRVIWFMENISDHLRFREMLQESVKGLDWDQLAQGYDASNL